MASIPLGSIAQILFRTPRSVGGIEAMCVITEEHFDEVEMTEHPIEKGANITDHAIIMPSELRIRMGWSRSPNLTAAGLGSLLGAVDSAIGAVASATNALGLTDIGGPLSQDYLQAQYKTMLDMMTARQPVEVYTGKRKYDAMLITSIATVTDQTTENALILDVTLRQPIIVSSQPPPAGGNPANMADPAQTAGQKVRGAISSGVQKVVSSVKGFFGG